MGIIERLSSFILSNSFPLLGVDYKSGLTPKDSLLFSDRSRIAKVIKDKRTLYKGEKEIDLDVNFAQLLVCFPSEDQNSFYGVLFKNAQIKANSLKPNDFVITSATDISILWRKRVEAISRIPQKATALEIPLAYEGSFYEKLLPTLEQPV